MVEFDEAVKPADTSKVEEDSQELENLKNKIEKQAVELIQKLARQETFTIDGKKYKRRKIKFKENKEVINLRNKLGNLDIAKDYEEYQNITEQIYKKLAGYCLVHEDNTPMSEEEFEDAEAEQITKILDGINFRILYGVPPS